MFTYRNINNLILLVTFLLTAGSMGLIACSGGENGSQTEQAETAQEATKQEEIQEDSGKEEAEEDSSARVIEIEGLDTLKFTVTEITASPGEEITVELVNNSSMPANAMSHNFVLLKKATNPGEFNQKVLQAGNNGVVPDELNEFVIANTGMVAGGESKSVTFTVPEEPGEYDYICTFPGHFAAGMKGKLIVKE